METNGDPVTARMRQAGGSPYLEDKLDLLGRLLIYTRQMDMIMSTDAHVDRLTECFLDGNYSLGAVRRGAGRHYGAVRAGEPSERIAGRFLLALRLPWRRPAG